MAEENENKKEEPLLPVNTVALNQESLALINQIIAENDLQKTKDLTNLFNINQNKKAIVRVNKLNDVMDALAEQFLKRVQNKPDEMSNADLMQGLNTVQKLIESGTKQVTGITEQPLIQINQQTIETNVGNKTIKDKASRERVTSAVSSILKSIFTEDNTTQNDSDVVDAEIVETGAEDGNN